VFEVFTRDNSWDSLDLSISVVYSFTFFYLLQHIITYYNRLYYIIVL